MEEFSLTLLEKVNSNYKTSLKLELAELSDYFRNVMEGDVGTYKKIREADLLYDPTHFIHPIRQMVRTGLTGCIIVSILNSINARIRP